MPSPVAENENVNEGVVQPTTEEPTTDVVEVSEDISATPPSPGEGNQPVSDVDEKGVPYENRYREAERKLAAQTDRLAKMEETLNNIQQSVEPKQQQFTYEQLEAWEKQNPEEAREYSEWLAAQKREALERAVMEKVTGKIQAQQQAQQQAIIQQQTLQAVAQQFPQAFSKDANGRLVDWDVSNPLTQRIIHYMENGAKERPDGLMVAAKLAAFDLSQMQAPVQLQQVAQQQATIGELQRKMTLEGSGAPATGSTHSDAVGRAVNTGNSKDAREALKSMFIQRGTLAG